MRARIRALRVAAKKRAERGVYCEEQTYTGPHRFETCVLFATGYQATNDIFVCGVHARAYLNVEPKEVRT